MKKPLDFLMIPVDGYKKLVYDRNNYENEKNLILNDKPTVFILKWFVSPILMVFGLFGLITGHIIFSSHFTRASGAQWDLEKILMGASAILGSIALHFFLCYRQYNSVKSYGIYLISLIGMFIALIGSIVLDVFC